MFGRKKKETLFVSLGQNGKEKEPTKIVVLEKEELHDEKIIDGLVYRTENAKKIAIARDKKHCAEMIDLFGCWEVQAALWKTGKGNWFFVISENERKVDEGKIVTHHKIRYAASEEDAKEVLFDYPELYQEHFGQLEEA